MDWRLGIYLGNILIDGEDILGDGVNLAARPWTALATARTHGALGCGRQAGAG